MALLLVVGVADLDRPVDPAREPRVAVCVADVVLEPADHHLTHGRWIGLDAAGEPLRVQHRQQRLPRLRVSVVRRGRQEQPVLAKLGRPSYRPGLLAVARDPPAARRRRRRAVVRLVHEQQVEVARVLGVGREHLIQQALYPRRAQPLQADHRPRVHRERVRLQPVAAAQFPQRGSVQDREVQAELLRHLLAPLQRQRRRAYDQHPPGPVSQQHLLDHQAGLDRLAQADIVGDQQVHPRHR